jgi:hypothetical protein
MNIRREGTAGSKDMIKTDFESNPNKLLFSENLTGNNSEILKVVERRGWQSGLSGRVPA